MRCLIGGVPIIYYVVLAYTCACAIFAYGMVAALLVANGSARAYVYKAYRWYVCAMLAYISGVYVVYKHVIYDVI